MREENNSEARLTHTHTYIYIYITARKIAHGAHYEVNVMVCQQSSYTYIYIYITARKIAHGAHYEVNVMVCQQSCYNNTRFGDPYLAYLIIVDIHKSCTSDFQMTHNRTVLFASIPHSLDTLPDDHITCYVSWSGHCVCHPVVHDETIVLFWKK